MGQKIFTVALLCLSQICRIQCNEEAVKALHDKCVAETGADEAKIAGMNHQIWPGPEMACYIKCIMSSIGVLSDDGIVDVDTMLNFISDDVRHLYVSSVTKCGTQPGKDLCETAYLTSKCYFDLSPEIYFMI